MSAWSRHPRKGFTLVELLVVIAIIAVLIGLLLPAVQKVREAAARMKCQNNLKQLALACHNYHDPNGCFPPNYLGVAYGVGEGDWSWIAMLLPFIEQQGLYAEAGLTGAFANGIPATPLNVAGGAVIATPIQMLRCPSDPDLGQVIWTDRADVAPTPVAITNYKGVCGSNWEWNTVAGAPWNPGWNPAGCGTTQGGLDDGNGIFWRDSGNGGWNIGAEGNPLITLVTIPMITDGASNTFMIGESLPSMSNWTGCWAYSNNACGTCAILPNAPQTSGLSGITAGDWHDNYSFHSAHTGGLQFAYADASVHFVANGISMAIYQAMGTRNGGELVTSP